MGSDLQIRLRMLSLQPGRDPRRARGALPALSPLCCPGRRLAGSPRKHCPAGDRKLNSPLARWHPSCHRSAGPKSSVIRGPQCRRGAQLAPAALSLPMAHVERWVDAALPLLRCQIISGHRHRRTRRGVRAVPGVPRGARPCRQLRAGTFPAVPSRPHGCRGSAARCHRRPPLPRRRLRARCVIRRSANSGATILRLPRITAMQRRGPRAPRLRAPLPPGPLPPCLLYPRRGISGGRGPAGL